MTYADIADLSYSAGLVALVRVDTMIAVDPSRSAAVRPGYGRFYIEAEARSLLVSRTPLGRKVRYLVDLPLDWRGSRPDDLEGEEVFVFARSVAGKPGELQLVTPTAQLRWNPAREARLRGLLREAVSPDAPPSITGVRALLHVPGALLGQGRTQIFLDTQDGSFASVTIRHQPGMHPSWHASFSELIADAGGPPAPESLEWYRLACSLPRTPPPGADISPTAEARSQARADYRFVLDALGSCNRSLHFRPQMTAQSFLASDQA
ncbi:hypothetical protein [Sphingobium baderi]|uniref:hypothetical protein n=1 Tax=Sphingobium baderi TaxID=1332080 RepID=UPI002B404DE7|nr:hypothetical protein [Sphingobium baderi]WRD78870.1 hypothetical protein QQ987_19585 [Sphingobium baderi]